MLRLEHACVRWSLSVCGGWVGGWVRVCVWGGWVRVCVCDAGSSVADVI